MFIDLVWELLRIGIGALCGVLALAFFFVALRTWQNPEEYERRRQVAIAIKRYKKGEITSEELERITPTGSLQFGVVFTTTPPYQFIRSVRIKANF